MSRLILASASPRRKELMEKAGYVFEIIKAVEEEKSSEAAPEAYVMDIALAKAAEVAHKVDADDEIFILSADTVVVNDGQILGKPSDREHAYAMLRALTGHSHSVFTGVTIMKITKEKTVTCNFFEETKVCVKDMTDDEIYRYIDTGECMDKAGAYAIQGIFADNIAGITGDYDNVVGLPVSKVVKQLEQMGYQSCTEG